MEIEGWEVTIHASSMAREQRVHATTILGVIEVGQKAPMSDDSRFCYERGALLVCTQERPGEVPVVTDVRKAGLWE